MLWEFHRARLRDGSAVTWEPEEGGASGWGREGRPQPHHQHPLCSCPVPPSSSRDWKPCFSLATEQLAAVWLFRSICFILLTYIFTSVHYHYIFTSVAPSSDSLCRDHAGRCACWSEETAQQWGSTNTWPRAFVTNNFYSPSVWRKR